MKWMIDESSIVSTIFSTDLAVLPQLKNLFPENLLPGESLTKDSLENYLVTVESSLARKTHSSFEVLLGPSPDAVSVADE